MTYPSLSVSLVQPPPHASFLGLPLELRDHVYDLVAAQSELIVRTVDQKGAILVIGWVRPFLACKQVYRECCSHTRMVETLRWELNTLESWAWGQNNGEAGLYGVLGPLCYGVRILKTLLKPDEAHLWDVVSSLPTVAQVHVTLSEENIDFDLSRTSLKPSAEKWLRDLVDPYFRRPPVVGWQAVGVGLQPMGLMNSLMIHAMSAAPWAPVSGRRRLNERSQRILDQQLERGVRFVVHVRLYSAPFLPRQGSIKDGKKLRKEWNVTLDGVTGELISKKNGQLCWRQLSEEEAWLEQFMVHRSGSDDSLTPCSIPARRDAPANVSCAGSPFADDYLLQRYTTLIERKPGNGKGKGKGQGQTDKQSKGRLTYSKNRNLQARML